MFVPESFGDGKMKYALNLGGMTSGFKWGTINGLPYREDAVVYYDFPAYFLSTRRKSQGALAVGKVRVVFWDDYAQELDGLDTYKNLSVASVLEMADKVRFSGEWVKEVRTSIDAIFGKGVMWSGEGRTDTKNMNLATMWFNLPEVPKGADAWFKFHKN